MSTFSSIKYIIFDLGNVVIDINFSLTVDALSALSSVPKEQLNTDILSWSYFKDHEKGSFSDEEFRNSIRNDLKSPHLADETIDAAWNKLLLTFQQERIDLLLKLKENYRTFALSNTNAIHIKELNTNLSRDTNYQGTLESLFEKAYFSHLIKEAKPDASAYQVVLEENNLNPEETLFIDDRLENIEAAEKLGLKTVHIVSPKTILDIPFHI